MKQVWRELRPLLAYMGLFSFCVNLLYLIPALFMLQVFDRVLTTHSGETLVVLLVGTAVAMVVMLLLDYVRQRLQGVLAAIADERLARPLVESLVGRAARTPHAAAGEGMRDLATLKTVLSSNALAALFDAPWAPLFLLLIWTFHPLLGLGALVSVVLMLALAWLNHRTSRAAIEGLQQDGRRATRYVESSLRNAEVLQALGMTGRLLDRWRALQDEVAALHASAGRGGVAFSALTRFVRQGIQIVMLSLGAWLVISQEASAGIMIATTVLLGRALQPVEQLVGSWRALADGRAAYRRLAELDTSGAAAQVALPCPAGRLQVEGLSYRVPSTGKPVLYNLSLSLEAGESLAIIGASAAGKSTLARLLIGLWAPATGSVRLDGTDVARWDRAQLGQWIGYVPQDVELFDGSVADNIARLAQVDAERVIAAAKRANAHDMILEFAEGYDTLVGEGGMRLSPGQRQRIALARALYGNPRLVVLDEPNANLDGAGELALAHAVNGLRADGVTTIIVTHRPALIAHVTKILVLENGRAKRYGAAAEVMRDMQRQAQAVVDTASAA
jgi:PrtD family type I secretion system ABC transporter